MRLRTNLTIDSSNYIKDNNNSNSNINNNRNAAYGNNNNSYNTESIIILEFITVSYCYDSLCNLIVS